MIAEAFMIERNVVQIPPEVELGDMLDALRDVYPPRHRMGITLFFTGLSGSGKSTIANALMSKLMEIGGRQISLLDGDIDWVCSDHACCKHELKVDAENPGDIWLAIKRRQISS